MVNPPDGGAGYVTLYPGGANRPNVSNLNFVPGQVVPNAFTVGLDGAGAFTIYASASIHVIVDITGYFAPPADGGLYFHPLPSPIRLLDTRRGQTAACDAPGTPLSGGSPRTEPARVSCNRVAIPPAARAVVGNATVVNPASGGYGFVTLWPSDKGRPVVSNLNYAPGQIVPNAFMVGLGSGDGAFKIDAYTGIDFIVDLVGYFAP